MKIEVKCSCGALSRLGLDCTQFSCLCGNVYERSGPPPGTWKKKKKPKYKNIKIELDGITFSSKLEADYYLHLKQLQAIEVVKSFEMQHRFTLKEAFDKNGEHFRAIEYVADFVVHYADGHMEIIDTKGMKTKDFLMKRKLFECAFPDLKLTIVRQVNGDWVTEDELRQAAKQQRQRERSIPKRTKGRRGARGAQSQPDGSPNH